MKLNSLSIGIKMKKIKIFVIISTIMLLLLINNVVANENISDLTGDLFNHYLDQDINDYAWKMATDEIPNIDIIKLSFTITDNITTFSIKVNGEIENSKYISYFISYTSTESNYICTYRDGIISGNASNTESISEDNEPEFSISNDTLIVKFESMGQGIDNVKFYGYASYSLEEEIDVGQSWVDYVPDSDFPYDIVEIEPNNDSNGNETDSNQDNSDTSSKTPSFELLSIIIALFFVFFIFRSKK